MRNVILGCAWQYQPDELAPFVLSWKRHCPEVEMILIIEPDATEEKIMWLLDQGVNLKFFTSGYFIQTNIANSRYFAYLDILLEEQFNYDRVFLTDTRDVVFQGYSYQSPRCRRSRYAYARNHQDSMTNMMLLDLHHQLA